MNAETFNEIVNSQIDFCLSILVDKAREYATEDRLHNFKVAAKLQNIPAKQALAGIMVKHTVSVYDMCRSRGVYPVELWEEKITDSINYLLLLKALVIEEV